MDNKLDFLKMLEDKRNELKDAPALDPEKERLQEPEKKIAAKRKKIEEM